MPDANVIDFVRAKKLSAPPCRNLETAIQEDLVAAIKLLIARLQAAKPLSPIKLLP